MLQQAHSFDLCHTTTGTLGWTNNTEKDLGHFWLGYIRMLGYLQMSAHLVNLTGKVFSFQYLVGAYYLEVSQHPYIT